MHWLHRLHLYPRNRCSESTRIHVDKPSSALRPKPVYQGGTQVDKDQKLSRRNFLRLSAAAAASTMIAACGGTPEAPAPAAGAPTAAGAAAAPAATAAGVISAQVAAT